MTQYYVAPTMAAILDPTAILCNIVSVLAEYFHIMKSKFVIQLFFHNLFRCVHNLFFIKYNVFLQMTILVENDKSIVKSGDFPCT